jgi:predicted RNase H-related nuclease YkuK (DUF458 family)
VSLLTDWFDGAGAPASYEQIVDDIKAHHLGNGTLYVGSDSQFYNSGVILTSAIILHGAEGQRGGRYFVNRRKLKPEAYRILAVRILAEAEQTIDIAIRIVEEIPDIKIELHVDVSNTDKNEATSNLAKMVIGYVAGSGFDCKVKPEAFAAASVADKHSK